MYTKKKSNINKAISTWSSEPALCSLCWNRLRLRQKYNEYPIKLRGEYTQLNYVCIPVWDEHSPVGGVWSIYVTSRELQHVFGWANTQVRVRLHMKQFWRQTVMRQVRRWRDVNLQLGYGTKQIMDCRCRKKNLCINTSVFFGKMDIITITAYMIPGSKTFSVRNKGMSTSCINL